MINSSLRNARQAELHWFVVTRKRRWWWWWWWWD